MIDENTATVKKEELQPDNEFIIEKGVLKRYSGNDNHVLVPDEVTAIGDGAFKNNKKLISVTLPENLTAIGHYAFNGCRKLTSIEIPESVTAIGDFAFKGCQKLPSLDIPQSVRRIGRGACDSTTMILH